MTPKSLVPFGLMLALLVLIAACTVIAPLDAIVGDERANPSGGGNSGAGNSGGNGATASTYAKWDEGLWDGSALFGP